MSAVLAPKPMTEAELISAIDTAEQHAYGSDSSSLTAELSAQRTLNIDLYLGNDVDPAPDGESSVVDRAVFEAVQWILPSLCRIFANGDDVVSLVPMNEGDVEQAKQESAYLNWLVTTKHPWFELFLEWATDALLTKNAYFLVYRNTKRSVEIEKYQGQTRMGLAYLLDDPSVELIDSREYQADDLPPEPVLGPDGQPMMQVVGVDPMTGQPVAQPVMGPAMLYDAVIRRASDTKDLVIRVLPPERVKVDQNTYTWRVDGGCDYFEYYEDTTISDLRKQGFDVPDDLAADFELETQEEAARDQFGETRIDWRPTDPSMRRVRARMVWLRVDADGDGKAELLQMLRVGARILAAEEVSRIPAASGVACPLPHRHIGLAVADMTVDIQRINTVLLRQGLNNLYLSNNPQKIVNEALVNIDDALISRPGGLIRSTDIDKGIRYEQAPFVFPQAVEGLQYMAGVAQNRTGVNNGFAGVDSASLNNIQPGTVNQLSSMAAERVVQIARVLAFAIEDLFSIVHEQVLKMGHKRETLQIAGKWVEVDPGSWKKRDSFKIAVAFAAGNKDAQIGRLMALAQKQVEALQLGLPVVTPENYYTTLMELTKAIDFTATDRFWTDPVKMPPKPPPPPPTDLVKAQMDNQTKIQLQQMADAQDERESLRKAELERYAIDANAGMEVLHSQVSHEHNVALANLETGHKAILDTLATKLDSHRTETTKAVEQAKGAVHEHASTLTDIGQTLNEVLAGVKHTGKLAAARKVVRKNDKGEIDGFDLHDHDGTVLQSHKAVRDQTGRVVGTELVR